MTESQSKSVDFLNVTLGSNHSIKFGLPPLNHAGRLYILRTYHAVSYFTLPFPTKSIEVYKKKIKRLVYVLCRNPKKSKITFNVQIVSHVKRASGATIISRIYSKSLACCSGSAFQFRCLCDILPLIVPV